MKKIMAFMILVVIVMFSGCSMLVVDNMLYNISHEYVPEEELAITRGNDCNSYKYQDKVVVEIKYSDRNDLLGLRTDGSNDDWSAISSFYHTILEGDFEKVAWYDDNLFILMEGTYYSIDIDEYEIAPLIEDEDGNVLSPEYELKEYTETEFKQLYPDHESFDWYGH